MQTLLDACAHISNHLRHGNFSQLGEAITDWEEMTKKLATLKEDAQNHLKSRADKANWAGVNAQVSREFIDKTAREFADAHTQADSITKILKDTRGELVDYRTQLTEAIARAENKNLTVVDTGHGTFTVMGNTRPDWNSDPSGKTRAGSPSTTPPSPTRSSVRPGSMDAPRPRACRCARP
ncbi:hypothetical protein AQI88_37550 [Streptomyces cellostaticus]|uniref:Uncharacterized protein n=1 Tax=Streptomyces cellostaticus TaxID=67285 RepID=A0A101NE60_9ACTN|nr:hypothetical protein AQI88_37550 [Streptomyces cellostaticus]GHI04449.1 hypothetical protein Scel_27700 [Streptomyces cellostaticus]